MVFFIHKSSIVSVIVFFHNISRKREMFDGGKKFVHAISPSLFLFIFLLIFLF